MIDWGRIAELENDLGAEEIPALVSVCLEEVSEALENLVSPTEAELHFIKGTAATLGLVDLAQIASEGESALKHNPASAIKVEQLKTAFELEKRELHQRFPDLDV